MSYARQDCPPAPGPKHPIIRIKSPQDQRMTILGSHIEGYWTHWTGDRSVLCLQNGAACPKDRHNLPRRWKGYLHVIDHFNGRLGFLELTPAAAQHLRDALEDCSFYRGMRFYISRTAGGKMGRLVIRMTTPCPQMQELPPAEPVLETLKRVFGE
jgi:hypothetical protein